MFSYSQRLLLFASGPNTSSHLLRKSRLNLKTKNKQHHAHFETRSSKFVDLAPIESTHGVFLLAINRNLGPILPCFRDIRAFVLQTSLF